MIVAVALVLAALAFTLSAAAGLGGSLVLVPAFTLLFGAKAGIALAAVLLGVNNVGKLVAYRHTIPWRAAAVMVVLTTVGAFLGARLLLAAAENLVQITVVVVVAAAFALERVGTEVKPGVAGGLALASGLVSGFAGTSGPLKGIALRSLRLDREHMVGAASLVSFAGDATKAAVLIPALNPQQHDWVLLGTCLVLVPLTTALGRRLNRAMGERAFAGLFWLVMAGYLIRLGVR